MHRIYKILKNAFFQKCLALNCSREENRRFCRHDWQHLIDVARICYILVLEEQAAGEIIPGAGKEQIKEVVYAAGLLHDIGRWQQYDTGEDHALVGAQLAEGVLKDAGFDGEEIALIVRAISRHRTGAAGGGPLGEYLRRADDLARPCWKCEARDECKKLARMETAGGLLY